MTAVSPESRPRLQSQQQPDPKYKVDYLFETGDGVDIIIVSDPGETLSTLQ